MGLSRGTVTWLELLLLYDRTNPDSESHDTGDAVNAGSYGSLSGSRTGEENADIPKADRPKHSCICPAHGTCARRNAVIPKLHWDKCQSGQCELLDVLYAKSRQSEVYAPHYVSTIGTQLLEIIETEIGERVSCGTCRNYLTGLNQTTEHDHHAIVKFLHSEISWPQAWRKKHAGHRQRISELVSPIVLRPEPPPATRYDLRFITTIAVGMRVAKRATPRWHETQVSITSAGFPQPIIFAEPDAECLAADVVYPQKLGAIGSFKTMCSHILERPEEWVLLCEDDIALSDHTLAYLRRFNLTNEVLSLYVPGPRQQPKAGWSTVTAELVGSLALLMRKSVLSQLVQTRAWKTWRRHDCVDRMVYRACIETGVPLQTHNPSLAQHTGDTPAIYADRKMTSIRHAKDWMRSAAWTPPLVTLITPTGDRQHSFALCERWMAQQDYTGLIQWIVIDDGHTPTQVTMGQEYIRRSPMDRHSLCRNIRAAIPQIRGEVILIIEDDDYYHRHYVSTMVGRCQRADLVGEFGAKYYYVRHQLWRHNVKAEHHASLCRTGMTRAVLPTLGRAALGDHPSIDLRLWRMWHGSTFTWRDTDGSQSLCVGIKGVDGRQSKGWRPSRNAKPDPDGEQLRRWVGDDAEFYRKQGPS